MSILESLGTWKRANPRKKFPPRKVVITGGPCNVGKEGYVMSRDAGLTQIATGVCEDGSPDCTWYSRWMFENANGKNRADFGKRRGQ